MPDSELHWQSSRSVYCEVATNLSASVYNIELVLFKQVLTLNPDDISQSHFYTYKLDK